jgi:hypothetical protein
MKQYLKPPSQNRFDCCCKALWWFLSTSLGWLSASAVADQESRDALPPLVKATVRSTLDEHEQPILYWAPARAKEQATPILILLHTWSGYFSQRHHDWQAAVGFTSSQIFAALIIAQKRWVLSWLAAMFWTQSTS